MLQALATSTPATIADESWIALFKNSLSLLQVGELDNNGVVYFKIAQSGM